MARKPACGTRRPGLRHPAARGPRDRGYRLWLY